MKKVIVVLVLLAALCGCQNAEQAEQIKQVAIASVDAAGQLANVVAQVQLVKCQKQGIFDPNQCEGYIEAMEYRGYCATVYKILTAETQEDQCAVIQDISDIILPELLEDGKEEYLIIYATIKAQIKAGYCPNLK